MGGSDYHYIIVVAVVVVVVVAVVVVIITIIIIIIADARVRGSRVASRTGHDGRRALPGLEGRGFACPAGSSCRRKRRGHDRGRTVVG